MNRGDEMSLGAKLQVLFNFIAVIGVFVGIAGLFFDWKIAKTTASLR
jgi:hypothetical protein